MKDNITITANGKTYEMPRATTLPAFLEAQQLERARVVVEHNCQPVTPQAIDHIVLQDGDALEIVQVVAGG